jgi:site-specific recombinase XerD
VQDVTVKPAVDMGCPWLHVVAMSRYNHHLLIETLTSHEIESLIHTACGPSVCKRRNSALIAVLYRAGLRISEALSLYPKDLDHKTGSIRVLRGKGGKSRVVGIDAGAVAMIDRWLDCRREYGIPKSAPLFCTLKGGPLSPSYVRKMLKWRAPMVCTTSMLVE